MNHQKMAGTSAIGLEPVRLKQSGKVCRFQKLLALVMGSMPIELLQHIVEIDYVVYFRSVRKILIVWKG